jgi:hypothetical protein
MKFVLLVVRGLMALSWLLSQFDLTAPAHDAPVLFVS